jgi:hypothetical protein
VTHPDIESAYEELCCYTLTHGDPAFIHQHVVDAFAAQCGGDSAKPIQLAFALIGLYLHVEKGFSGRAVQRVHGMLARHKRAWPAFDLPQDRGSTTARDVLGAPPGIERDQAIHKWCASVWAACRQCHAQVAALLHEAGF